MAGFATLASAELPAWLGGASGIERDGGLPLGLGSVPQADERVQIVLEVVRFEAQREFFLPNTCLDLRPSGMSLTFPTGGGGAGWQAPTTPPPESTLERPRRLHSEAELIQSVSQSAAASLPVAKPMVLPREEVPPLLRSENPECGRLSYSEPVIRDDWAFVDIGYLCGGLCGHGWRYALRRRHDRWQLEALNFL